MARWEMVALAGKEGLEERLQHGLLGHSTALVDASSGLHLPSPYGFVHSRGPRCLNEKRGPVNTHKHTLILSFPLAPRCVGYFDLCLLIART